MTHKPLPSSKQKRQTPAKDLPILEKKRLSALLVYERQARQQGYSSIAGVDEAGRGPLAGPVVAAACVIPENVCIPGINDSKLLSPQKRSLLFEQLTHHPEISWGVGIVSHEEIDQINILQATIKAMHIAISKLQPLPDYLLVDGLMLSYPEIPCKKIIGGDRLAYCIAAASIIAKETRDRLMIELSAHWPEYSFHTHKGYGTAAHLQALERHGPSPIHRKSFQWSSK
jgi:ribonuclease HII